VASDSPSETKTETPATVASCIACGYDLRGLRDEGACPECGRAIVDSRQAATLRDARAVWLPRTARWAKALALIELLGACTYALWLYDSLRQTILQSFPAIPLKPWYTPVHATLAVVGLIALWLFTAPPPKPADESSQESIRMWLRFVAIWNTVGIVFLAIDRAWPYDILRIWEIAINLLAAATEFLFWSYVIRWAARIPDENLVRRSRSIRWGLVLGLLAGPTLGWFLHNNFTFAFGFRLFGPLPGRLIYLFYYLSAPFALLSFAACLRRLGDDPRPRIA
jgi:hypothetical protein